MLTERMNYDEMYNECVRDSSNALKWLFHKGIEIRRASLKAKTFPLIVKHTYVSPLRNEWTSFVVITKKIRKFNSYHQILFTRLRTNDGDYCFKISPEEKGVIGLDIFLPHFMKRYAERMHYANLHGQELADKYFLNNITGAYSKAPNKDNEHCMCTHDGVALGELINNRMFVAKTFITYEMAFFTQDPTFQANRLLAASEEAKEPIVVDEPIKGSVVGRTKRDKTQKKIF